MGAYKICSRFSWKKLSSGCVILDLEKGSYFTLNETASVIWSGLVEGRKTEDIAQELTSAFDVTEAGALADVGKTLALLEKEGVLESC